MLFDLAAWVVILFVAWAVGRGVLALLRVDSLRPGDQAIIAAWIGVVVLATALLGVSIIAPLRPLVVLGTAAVLTALGVICGLTAEPSTIRAPIEVRRRWRPIAISALCLAIGTAALTSDVVTLYDSLVYHVGIVRWLSEHGTVPGMALLHNRLGHVSAWFTLAAAFDHGLGENRSATVPLGVALLLVGVQTAIAVGRLVARRAIVADWFIVLVASAFIWAVAEKSAATPSPDVATNVLVAVSAWSMLVVSDRTAGLDRTAAIGPAMIPLLLALGATTMKLFAAPVAAVAAAYFIASSRVPSSNSSVVTRALVSIAFAAIVLGPFIAASVVASGCPVYPSPIGCTQAPWSVGNMQAADYAEYIRDVARWERRGNTPAHAPVEWIIPWMRTHPVVTFLALASAAIGFVFVRQLEHDTITPARRPERTAARAIVGIALVGIVFAAWQAPAPRFLFAVVVLIPAMALAYRLHRFSWLVRFDARDGTRASRQFVRGFAAASVVISLLYAVASQKLNVWSAVTRGAPLVHVARADLILPAAPAEQARLFRWRVNDVDVVTAVPAPIADTLGYHSVIAHNAEFEKCSTAPLPCTPYIPSSDVRLRRPSLGPGGGFVRATEQDYAGRVATCIGELTLSPTGRSDRLVAPAAGEDPADCRSPVTR